MRNGYKIRNLMIPCRFGDDKINDAVAETQLESCDASSESHLRAHGGVLRTSLIRTLRTPFPLPGIEQSRAIAIN